MPVVTSSELVQQLRVYRVLEDARLEEAEQSLVAQFPDAKALAKELLRRGWLSAYQVNQIFLERWKSLLLGSYVLVERLGGGGMGEVFKARNWKLRTTVALKIMRKDRVADPAAVQRFYREIRAAAQLTHPNIVRAYDADEVNGTHVLVMEHVEGSDLAKLVKIHGPLPIDQACDFVRQAAAGLQHAHELGMVHRDIKPHNLLLSVVRGPVPTVAAGEGGSSTDLSRPHGHIKILDMGLARLSEPGEEGTSQSMMTQEGAVMGTPDYIAPEQARESHTVDIRADLYSLGCTFYFLLTGSVPFPKGSLIQKLTKHQRDEPPAVESLRPEVPPAIGAIVRQLMAKRPEDRFQTPAELISALAGENRLKDPSATAASISEAVASAALAPPPVPVPASARAKDDDPASMWSSIVTPSISAMSTAVTTGPPSARRGKAFWLAVGAVILLVVVGAILLWLKLGRGPARAQEDPDRPPVRPVVKLATNVDGSWIKQVAELPAAEQVAEVARMLRVVNPGFDGVVRPTVDAGAVTGLDFLSDQVKDLGPMRALPKLKQLACAGRGPGKGRVTDLAPLAGLRLESLDCRYTQVSYLGPLQDMPLKSLNCAWTHVADLTPLRKAPLQELDVQGTAIAKLDGLRGLPLRTLQCGETKVTDLTPLKGMPLTKLRMSSTEVSDLRPLGKMPLTDLGLRNTDVCDLESIRALPLTHLSVDYKPWRDRAVLEAIKTLQVINGVPEKKFWRKVEADKLQFEAWAAQVANHPVKKQVAEVAKELVKRNPAFSGIVEPTVANEVVIGLRFMTDQIRDLSPVRALVGLQTLECRGANPGSGRLVDLSPLAGTGLTTLICYNNKISDLGAIRDLKLRHLNVDFNPVKELGPLKGMPLDILSCTQTKVTGLEPLATMQLATLRCGDTAIADLAPLQGMPLDSLNCAGTAIESLSALEGMMPLKRLDCSRTKIADLTPLGKLALTFLDISSTKVKDVTPVKDLPLEILKLNFSMWRDHEPLRSMATLKTINNAPRAQIWKPLEDHEAWCKMLAPLKAEDQEIALVAELKKRNRGFKGPVKCEIEGGVITGVHFESDNVTYLSPLRALPGLKRLSCAGSAPNKGNVADLWPLKGMSLVYLNADFTKAVDLTPLKNLPLEYLSLKAGNATDLAPLKGLPLKELNWNFRPVNDLSILRAIPTLQVINGEPAQQVLDKYEKK